MPSDTVRSRGFLCPRCRQRHLYRGRAAGEWFTCACGEHFAVPERPKRPDALADPAERLVVRAVYAVGAAFLLAIPAWLIAVILGLFVGPVAGWLPWAAAAVGFLIGALLGERGVNAVGRVLRSFFEWRF